MEHSSGWIDFDLPYVRRRYDRIARYFVFFEWLFLLPRGIRSRAVARMEVRPGDRVLEVGCGTGRNLGPIVDAVGTDGTVYGVDLSDGMLAEASALCRRSGWRNVTLLHADATDYTLPCRVDGVIFSLSYAVIPRHREALRHAWSQLRSGGWLVIMDARVPSGTAGKLLRPFVFWTSRLTVLGNPDVEPWEELRELTGQVEYEEAQFGTYYICRGRKP